MKIISATTKILLSSSVLTLSLAFSASSNTDSTIKQQEAHPDNVKQFLDLMNKKSSILAFSGSQFLRRTQEMCAPVAPFEYSSLSEEVKKEIEDVIHPSLVLTLKLRLVTLQMMILILLHFLRNHLSLVCPHWISPKCRPS